MARRELPEINASSMADIAFLLLTFFLIATTLNKDEGIQRIVPDPNQPIPDVPVNERNLYRILVNQMGQIQINGENAQMGDIYQGVIDFVDNGGGESQRKKGETCTYCQGNRLQSSSDTPWDAIVSLELDGATPYNYFFTAENYVDRAYLFLQDRYCVDKFNMTYRELEAKVNDKENATQEDIDHLEEVRNAYPKQIAKARLRNN